MRHLHLSEVGNLGVSVKFVEYVRNVLEQRTGRRQGDVEPADAARVHGDLTDACGTWKTER